MEKQNETLNAILVKARGINAMTIEHTSNVSENWEILKQLEARRFNKLETNDNKLTNLTIKVNKSIDLQRETKQQINNQVHDMNRLRNELEGEFNNNSMAQTKLQGNLGTNVMKYDAKTKELKLSIAQTEYRVMNKLMKLLQTNITGVIEDRGGKDKDLVAIGESKL